MALTAKKVYAILKRQISDMEAKIKTPIIYRGTVATADLLPLNPDIGDMYNIESKSIYGEAGMNVAWNGVAWDTMGAPINMSLYIKSSELADWAKQQNKPTYTAEEVGALPADTKIPSKTSDLQNDSGFLTKIPDNYLSGTDKTLSASGKAADAKAVGDKNVELLADISNKLNKNQGSENSGKIAGINESGDIVPMFPVSVDYNEETNCLEFGSDQKMELNKGINLDSTLTKTGYAADAGVVGEVTNSLKEDLVNVTNINTLNISSMIENFDNKFFANLDKDNPYIGDLDGYSVSTIEINPFYEYYINTNSPIFRIGISSQPCASGVVLSDVKKLDGSPSAIFSTTNINLKYLYIMYKAPTYPNVSLSIYNRLKAKNINTINISAQDSSDYDKQKSDIICGETNNERELIYALKRLSEIGGGNIILSSGNYYIDGLQKTSGVRGGAIYFDANTDGQCDIFIKGNVSPLRKIDEQAPFGGAIIHIRPALFDQIKANNLTKNFIFGYFGQIRQYPKYNLKFKNLSFLSYSNQYPLSIIDGKYLSSLVVENVYLFTKVNANPEDPKQYDIPNTEYKAIVTPQGSALAINQHISDVFCWGFGIGYECNAEHMTMERVGARYCYVPYRFSAYRDTGVNSHDITLINCCYESCIYGISFAQNEYKQSINLYDFNMEIDNDENSNFKQQKMSYEQTAGEYRGNIYYSCVYKSGVSVNVSVPFFENGSGVNMNVVDTTALLSGTIGERPETGNPRQKYYATDENKEYIYMDGWHEL